MVVGSEESKEFVVKIGRPENLENGRSGSVNVVKVSRSIKDNGQKMTVHFDSRLFTLDLTHPRHNLANADLRILNAMK